MLRVVAAVALATALLAVSMPAVETARVDHAHSRMDTELDELESVAKRLRARNDPAPPGVGGARRTLVLRLPGRSWGSASLDILVIPGPSAPHQPGVVRYRVAGGRQRTRSMAVPLVGPDDGLRVRDGGRRRVVLEYTLRGGDPVVLVRLPELKSEAATSPRHDAVASLGPAWR